MRPASSFRFAVIAAALLVSGAMAEAASPDVSAKPPRRLPPSPTDSNRIPAGVDTGSPASSDTLPLGTPVLPANAGDKGAIKARSAAARAAARPRSASAPAASAPPAKVQP
ncbi:MAG: hypothetical protein ABIO71_03410 [Caldimonas sp.]